MNCKKRISSTNMWITVHNLIFIWSNFFVSIVSHPNVSSTSDSHHIYTHIIFTFSHTSYSHSHHNTINLSFIYQPNQQQPLLGWLNDVACICIINPEHYMQKEKETCEDSQHINTPSNYLQVTTCDRLDQNT